MYRHYLILDLETYRDESAISLLEKVRPDGRLNDEAKIAADLAIKRQRQMDDMALDPWAGRIVALGWQRHDMTAPEVRICRDVEEERSALLALAEMLGQDAWMGPPIIGYRITSFDWPYVVTRSRLLGVHPPRRSFKRYDNEELVDLYQTLTCNGMMPPGVLSRSLQSLARRLEIPVTDPHTGADVAGLVASVQWSEVAAHCGSDVALTLAVAKKVGVISS